MQIRNNNLRAVLFDLDGVIVDTAKYHYQAWKKLADEEGIYFDEVINERLKGVSRMDSLNIILEKSERKYIDDEKKQLTERKNSYYVSMLGQLTPGDLLSGVKEFIGILKDNSIKTAICSASKNTKTILGKLDIEWMFDTIVSGNETSRSKPDPQVFLIASIRLGIPAGSCLVIEDSAAGIEAAVLSGMKSIGIGEKNILFKADYITASTNGLSLQIAEGLFEPLAI